MPHIASTEQQVRIAGEHFRGELWLAPQWRGELHTADPDRLTAPAVIENFMRLVAAYTSLAQGGLFMHSAAIICEGAAWMFLGRSGAGKSTLSRRALESGLGISSDDCNILRPVPGGGFEVAAVPFAGELGDVADRSQAARPLAGLVWLRQSAGLGLGSLGGAQQLAHLLACCPVVNVDPLRLDELMEVCHRLLASYPMGALDFRRDEDFRQVQQLLQESYRDVA